MILNVGTSPQQFLSANTGPVLICNLDLTNTLFIGYDRSITLGGPAVSEVPPLGSLALDVEDQLFAYSTANISAMAVPGGTSWSPSPAQVAEQISALGLALDASVNAPSYGPPTLTSVNNVHTSVQTVNGTLGTPAQTADVVTTLPSNIAATGVPLLAGRSVLGNVSNTLAASASTNVLNAVGIVGIGYEIAVILEFPAGTANPAGTVTLQWNDSLSGQVTGREKWILAGSSTAPGQKYRGTGPTKGDQLTVTLANDDTAQTLTYQIVVVQNSSLYQRDDWRNASFGAVPTFTLPNQDFDNGIICQVAASLVSGGTGSRILPLYAGYVDFTFINGANANSAFVISTPFDAPVNNAGSPLYTSSPTLAANAVIRERIALPRQTCLLTLNNAAGAATILAAFGVISEQLP